MTDFVGRPLGSQYRIGEVIGRGGMGEVRRGTDLSGAAVAVKTLLPQFAEDTSVVARFLAERQMMTNVRDRHVVRVRDLVAEGSTLAIVMDLVEGTDLRHYLAERGTLPAAESCRLGSQVASGLAAIHAARIVHRDVKPANVLLDRSVNPPVAMLTDFGVAKLLAAAAEPSGATLLAGTPTYLAPELLLGATPEPQADLYSLGIVLYELICGVPPFAGMPAAVFHAQLALDPGRPEGVDDRLWELMWQLLRKDPAQRPRDASTVATQLLWLSHELEGIPARAKAAVAPVPSRESRTASGRSDHPTKPELVTPQPGLAAAGAASPAARDWSGQPERNWDTPTTLGLAIPPAAVPSGQDGRPWFPQQPAHAGPWQPSVADDHAYPPSPATYPVVMAPGFAGAQGTSSHEAKRSPLLLGIIAGLFVVIIGMVLFWVMTSRDQLSAAEPSSVASPPTTAASEQPVVPATVASAPAVPVPDQDGQAPTWPPSGTTLCDSATAVNEATSCSFAANVAVAHYTTGPGVVQAYSPVTGQWYDMTCRLVTASVVECRGGTNAVVYVRQ